MSSTEFTIGLNGSRVSSKVLRPPGGGSSDIFGLGPRKHVSSNGNEETKYQSSASNTQNRLFGAQNEAYTPSKTNVKSNIFEKEMPSITKSVKKCYVRRNPITGEEIIMNPENGEKMEINEKEENHNKEETNDKQENDSDNKKIEIPVKTVQTSIRIRNPPGGKSSGIF